MSRISYVNLDKLSKPAIKPAEKSIIPLCTPVPTSDTSRASLSVSVRTDTRDTRLANMDITQRPENPSDYLRDLREFLRSTIVQSLNNYSSGSNNPAMTADHISSLVRVILERMVVQRIIDSAIGIRVDRDSNLREFIISFSFKPRWLLDLTEMHVRY